MKNNYFSLIFFIIVLFIILLLWDTILFNILIILTLKRGILSQNCFWWKVSEFNSDLTGAQIYQKFKTKGRFVKINVLGRNIYLLTDLNDIKQLLDLSPNPFGPGVVKKNFFDTFMPKNVGISVNPEWKYRREYNDKVLQTDKNHYLNPIFDDYIKESFLSIQPKNFEEFTELTKQLTSKIIFGTYQYNPIIYKVFKEADSIFSALLNINTVNSEDLEQYKTYLNYELQNPKENTLISIANKYHKLLPTDEIIDQIPHWIFPIAGLFSVHLPRLLVVLANHPDILEQVIIEIKNNNLVTDYNYTRKCILEMFRLNNPVNSTFRQLLESFTFNNSDKVFEKGDQLVFFNNPLMRDLFDYPNQFVPSRWNTQLENSYRALMFNQGNQRCPGKELSISLLTMAIKNYLEINNYTINTTIKIDTEFIPYLINPCTITFS
jgi:hypothetical protein